MISITEIATRLGETAKNVGTLCKSANINKWSFWKPVNLNKLTPITAEDLYSVNDGLMVYDFPNPQRLLYEIQHPNASNIWSYYDREPPFRLGDFYRYQHLADPLCFIQWIGTDTNGKGGSLKFELLNLIFMVYHWQCFSGMSSGDICVLIYRAGTEYDQSGTKGVYVQKIKSIQDIDDDTVFRIKIPESFDNDLTYEMRPVVTTWTSFLGDGETYYINPNSSPATGVWYSTPHHCFLQFHVSGSAVDPDFDSYWSHQTQRASWTLNGYHLSNIYFQDIFQLDDTSKTATISVEYWYDNSFSPVKIGEGSCTLNSSHPTETITVSYPGPIEIVSEADLENKLGVRIVLEINISGTTQHDQQSIVLLPE